MFDTPPSRTNLIFLPNSSITSSLVTGLILVEILALGAARGYFKILRSFLVTECFGNLTAKVFLLFVTFLEILLSFFRFKTKVIGPGQNFLYNLIKLLFI